MATALRLTSKSVIMARFYKYLLPLTSFLLLLTSCQEGREAGDLLGMWRLTGSDSNYISFAGSVTLFRDGKGAVEVFGNFQHKGDSLFIQCFSKKGERADTILVEDSFGFKPFNNIRLKIDRLDDDNLVLSNSNQRWNYYKY